MDRAQSPSAELHRIVDALNDIGIEAQFVETADGFLEGVRIVNGALPVTPTARVSNLLHEAGHLACIPRRYRHLANDDIDVLMAKIFDEEPLEPETPLFRALIQCSDSEATAWAWAFGIHLGLAPETVIEDDQYPDELTGEPGGEIVRLQVSMGMYLGVNGLARAGFCSTNRFGQLPKYPKLAFWTQEL